MIFHSTLAFLKTRRRLALTLVMTGLIVHNRGLAQQSAAPTSPQLYSQGNPTNEEQYLLERLNRARLDPVGEGQRLAAWLRNTPDGQGVVSQYGTNPDQVVSDFAALPAVQPLAFNSDLITAATGHASDIAAHNGQGPNGDEHNGWDGSTPSSRVYATGLRDVAGNNPYYGECAGSDNQDLDEIHAGYLVDWGNPAFGHRQIEMNSMPQMGVVGIGLATQPDHSSTEIEDYAAGVSNSAFLTGVVYNDANGNGLYDVGEGVSGVMVTVDGAACMAETSASGGYSVPLVRADGTNITGTVAVHMLNLPDGSTRDATVTVKTVTLSNGYADPLNVKWDVQVANASNPAGSTLSGGGTTSRSAEGKVFITVQRPSGSDLTLPLDVPLVFKGNAVAGVDYKTISATVAIPAGSESYRLKVKALNGDESDSTVTLTIKIKGQKGAQGKATVILAP